ncbi:MAG: quinohemoprotein amine dehydrogenase subunit beta [Acidobacteria bacterium]|nr:MAG: quinohemoprotein amine dehydrogenase subunit beta [Acidobacteriota bacterium]
MNRSLSPLVVVSILLASTFFSFPRVEAAGGDWIIAASHPNIVYVIDGTTDDVIRRIPLSGPGYPYQIAIDPPRKRAYVITNKWESIAIVDLDAGREVGTIELSHGAERVKAMALAVHPSGERLYVYEVPTLLGLDRLEVRPTRLEEFGLPTGKSLRTIPVPRQVTILAVAPAGEKLYAFAQDAYVVDLQRGRITETIPLKHVGITGLGEPDILSVWPNYEQTQILSLVYSVENRIKPDAPLLGIVNVDLATGSTEWIELETVHRIIFSSVISPSKKKAYLVYTTLSRVDLEKKRLERIVDLDHTYYVVNISSDGKKLYIGGAQPDIAVVDAESLKVIKKIKLRGDQSIASLRVMTIGR